MTAHTLNMLSPPSPYVSIKSIILPLILIRRIDLPNIPLQHQPDISLHRLLAILIVIHPLLSIACNNVLPEETYRFDCHLPFACSLFD